MSKPLLASEVLRDEVAPLEPGRRAARIWLVGVALAVAALQVSTGSELVSWAWAVAALVLAALPLPYAARAALLVLLGGGAVLLGQHGLGPLSENAGDPSRLMAAIALPTAIAFRGHYRRFLPALAALAAALAASAPYALLQLRELLDHGLDWPTGLLSLIGLTAVLIAPLVLVPQPKGWPLALIALAGIGLEAAGFRAASGVRPALQQGVALVAAASVTSLGLFQLLAWASAGRARRQLQLSSETDEELEQRISVG